MAEDKKATVEEKTTQAADKKTAATATAEKFDNVIYIGPNKLSKGLKKNTIYRGDVSEMVKGLTAQYANISRLFVKVSSLSDAMVAVKQKGTPIYLAYHEVERSE